jgi:hypothetical protein
VYLTFFISNLEGKWYRLFQSDEILMFKLLFTIVVRFCYYTFMKLCMFFYFSSCLYFFGCKFDFNYLFCIVFIFASK